MSFHVPYQGEGHGMSSHVSGGWRVGGNLGGEHGMSSHVSGGWSVGGNLGGNMG